MSSATEKGTKLQHVTKKRLKPCKAKNLWATCPLNQLRIDFAVVCGSWVELFAATWRRPSTEWYITRWMVSSPPIGPVGEIICDTQMIISRHGPCGVKKVERDEREHSSGHPVASLDLGTTVSQRVMVSGSFRISRAINLRPRRELGSMMEKMRETSGRVTDRCMVMLCFQRVTLQDSSVGMCTIAACFA